MNVVCALLIMIIVTGVLGFTTTTVDTVAEDSPAAYSSLKPGDEIAAIDGKTVDSWGDVSQFIAEAEGEPVNVTVNRDGSDKDILITPEVNQQGGYVIGITCQISHNPFRAVVEGSKATWNMTVNMFDTLGQLFTGKVGADNLSGPVGMVQMVSETSQYGLWYYGFLTALICMNLAIINMLPLPALDGGRLVFLLIELIFRKPVPAKYEGWVHAAGFVLLMVLMGVIAFSDVLRLVTGKGLGG